MRELLVKDRTHQHKTCHGTIVRYQPDGRLKEGDPLRRFHRRILGGKRQQEPEISSALFQRTEKRDNKSLYSVEDRVMLVWVNQTLNGTADPKEATPPKQFLPPEESGEMPDIQKKESKADNSCRRKGWTEKGWREKNVRTERRTKLANGHCEGQGGRQGIMMCSRGPGLRKITQLWGIREKGLLCYSAIRSLKYRGGTPKARSRDSSTLESAELKEKRPSRLCQGGGGGRGVGGKLPFTEGRLPSKKKRVVKRG